MEYFKTKKGVSLITLVISIVTIIILAAMSFMGNDKTIDEAAVIKFKQEITEIKRVVDTKKLINSKQGLDEEIINKGFDKVLVKDPPSNFVSVDDDKLTAYIIRLNDIDYEDLKTGQQYKKIKSGDTVTFNKDDIYIYDKVGTVFYLKGIYREGSETLYTADETKVNGPLVSAENTEGGKVSVKVTPTNGGIITNVTVGNKIAIEMSEGIYEVEIDKNGSYIVAATEDGSGTSRTTVNVTKITEETPTTVIGIPTVDFIRINNGEAYTKNKTATLHISGDADLVYIKRYTTGAFPTPPTANSPGWQNYTTEVTLNKLDEGENSVFVWFRKKGNSTIISKVATIIVDIKPPTTDKPDVEVYDEHSFRITAKQEDYSSGLKKLEVGYKLVEDSDYKWVEISDLVSKTIEIENNKPNKSYQIKTRAKDNVGNESESYEYITALNNIPMGVKIEYNPTTGWTKRSMVTITYPSAANDIYQKWYRLAGGEWKITNNFVETIHVEEKMTIEAVVVKKMTGETLFGEITSVTINNIDTQKPEISNIELVKVNLLNNENYRGTAQITDLHSGIVAYAVNESDLEPTTWEYLKETKNSLNIEFDAIAGHGYYIWVKDAAENINSTYIEVEAVELDGDITVKLDRDEHDYTGLEIKPKVDVMYSGEKLTEDIHYTVTYENNINVGTAKFIIIGKKFFSEKIEGEFSIVPAKPTIILENITYKYDGTIKEIAEAKVIGTPNSTKPLGSVKYTYYTNEELTEKTSIINGAQIVGGPPSEVGSYYVVAEIEEEGNYASAISNKAILSIQLSAVTITFSGDSVNESTKIVYYNHAYGENGDLPTPTREGYTFDGWYTSTNYESQITNDSIVNIVVDHILYAKWILK